MKTKVYYAVIFVLIFMIICLTVLVWLGSNKNSEPNISFNPEPAAVILSTSVTTKTDNTTTITSNTTAVTESTSTEAAVTVSNEALLEIFDKSGHDIDEIGDSQQIITVEADGTSCQVKLFERNGEQWENIRTMSGVVGKNGVSEKSSEGDYCTPEGIYSLGFAFGTEPMSGLSIEYRQINSNCYWVDDSESPLYNQWIESSNITWNSAEHLVDYPKAYKYAVVVNYNMSPVIPYKGSAIFLHCMTGSYTAGCIAISEDDMLFMLNHLDSNKMPVIIIK